MNVKFHNWANGYAIKKNMASQGGADFQREFSLWTMI